MRIEVLRRDLRRLLEERDRFGELLAREVEEAEIEERREVARRRANGLAP
jgi:hypothetical protein